MEKSGARSDGKAHRLNESTVVSDLPTSAQKPSFRASSKPLILRSSPTTYCAAHKQVIVAVPLDERLSLP
jgi:hypothetical protein